MTSALVTSARWSSPNPMFSVSTPAVWNTSFIIDTQESLSAAAQKSSLGSRSQSATFTVSAVAANAASSARAKLAAIEALEIFFIIILSGLSLS